MKNKLEKSSPRYFNLILLLLLSSLPGFTHPTSIGSICPGPQPYVTSQSTGSVSFSWSPVSGASEYVVFYVRQNDQYTSPEIHTSNTSITFSGLASGTYDFYFKTVCGSGNSGIIIVEDLLI